MINRELYYDYLINKYNKIMIKVNKEKQKEVKKEIKDITKYFKNN